MQHMHGLLSSACVLQTYISALDEDLGKAQARMDIILGADNSSAAKQNELLKAAAKQVTPCCVSCALICIDLSIVCRLLHKQAHFACNNTCLQGAVARDNVQYIAAQIVPRSCNRANGLCR